MDESGGYVEKDEYRQDEEVERYSWFSSPFAFDVPDDGKHQELD